MLTRILALLSASLMCGCASIVATADPEANEQKIGVDRHSSFPAMRRIYFEQVNLVELVDPSGHAAEKYKTAWDEAKQMGDRRQWGRKYDLVFAWFRDVDTSDTGTMERRRLQRNSIQERILSVSISRCNVFKTFLRRDQADKNFALGSATTIAGALGAILQGATASRNLAGTAGILSGVQAEYNQAYFSNLTAAVIIKGIESRQSAVYERIRKVGQPMSLAEYPLEAAIKDAVYFDGLCSTVVGLEEAGESINLANNPGPEAASRTVLRSRLLQRIATDDLTELSKSELLPRLGITIEDIYKAPVAVSPGPTAAAPAGTAGDEVYRAIDRAQLLLNGAANDLAAAYAVAYGAREKALSGSAFDAQAAAKGQSERGAKYAADIAAALIAPLKLADCNQLASKAATELAAAQNQLRAAPDEAQRVGATQLLASRQLKAESLRRKITAMAQLVEIDMRQQATAHLALVAKAEDAKALAAIVAPGFTSKASSDWNCGTLSAKE